MEILFELFSNPIALFILIGVISSLFNKKKQDGQQPQRRPVRPPGPMQQQQQPGPARQPRPAPARRQPAEARVEQMPEVDEATGPIMAGTQNEAGNQRSTSRVKLVLKSSTISRRYIWKESFGLRSR